MSVRLYKFMGYGLDDIKSAHEDDATTENADKRINWDADYFTDEERYYDRDEYLKWLLDGGVQTDFDIAYLRDGMGPVHTRDRRIDQAVAYEYGKVLAIQPLAMWDWSRFDNPMDYNEEVHLHKNLYSSRVQHLPDNLYPFSTYMDARTGLRLDNWHSGRWNRAISDLRENPNQTEDIGNLDDIAVDLGFADSSEAKQHFAPEVPKDVTNLARYMKLFTDDDVALQLRPMIFTYWS